MIVVPDASAMVEFLRRTPTGRVLQQRFVTGELVAPELLDVEVASAYGRQVLRGDTTLDEARQALDLLRRWPIRRIGHSELIPRSLRWWPNVSAYDAVYLAVAAGHGASLLTVDGPLARARIADVVIENVRVGA